MSAIEVVIVSGSLKGIKRPVNEISYELLIPFFLFQGEAHQGLIVLQKGVDLCFPEGQVPFDTKSKLIHGQALLLVGRFMEETANFESNAVMKKYKVKTESRISKH